MFGNKRFIAIIPARGGSKRLHKKNSLLLHGKPLISWTIEAAQKSKFVDEIVVSTDDDEILDIAIEQSVKTIVRPSELATDVAPTIDVIKHVLSKYTNFDYVILLQPTSPLRTSEHIDQAIDFLMVQGADSVVSVCKTEHNPLWSNVLPQDRRMDLFIRNEIRNVRSQDLPQYFRLNGAIYICIKDRLLSEQSFVLPSNCFGFEMDVESSVDIDTMLDFEFASFLMEKK